MPVCHAEFGERASGPAAVLAVRTVHIFFFLVGGFVLRPPGAGEAPKTISPLSLHSRRYDMGVLKVKRRWMSARCAEATLRHDSSVMSRWFGVSVMRIAALGGKRSSAARWSGSPRSAAEQSLIAPRLSCCGTTGAGRDGTLSPGRGKSRLSVAGRLMVACSARKNVGR